ncbi:alpha/beta fold hydrolase [Hyphobacterium sp.]|uniref:alpha/beta fold hydrolase n=1 Tax=Hyphobacterium sp. TaxID=2004662 RepID=UPI003B5249BF
MTIFPDIEPYASGTLETGDGHQIYWERCGKRGGIPLVWLHGGPGSGCTAAHRCFFDPERFDVLLFDQRGCGRSTPKFSLENNSTQHLIADIERLRQMCEMERWIVAGASWGSTLALAYAETHPESVTGVLVTAVFLSTDEEIAWWHCHPGAPNLFPDAFETFLNGTTAPETSGLHGFLEHCLAEMQTEIDRGLDGLKLLEAPTGTLDGLRQSLLYRWTEYEERISWLESTPDGVRQSLAARGAAFVACHSLIEAHYFANRCFLEADQLIRNAGRLDAIPLEIVQSRYDVVCPPQAAFRLHATCPHARLSLVAHNGHAMTEAVHPAFRTAVARLAEPA